jgi:predicted  nucleic acid-binding Zn-ribbon protein
VGGISGIGRAEFPEPTALDAAKAKATLDAFARQHHLVTGEAVGAARHERDEVWRKVRAAGTVVDFVNQYEARVAAADGMADQRYDGAAKIEQQATLQTARDALQAEVEVLDRQITAADRQLAELDSQWRQRMAGLGLVLTPLQLAEWSRLRDDALAAAEARTEADGEGRALADETTDVANALRAALAKAGVTPAEGAAVPVLAAHAETTNAERTATATRVSEWEGERLHPKAAYSQCRPSAVTRPSGLGGCEAALPFVTLSRVLASCRPRPCGSAVAEFVLAVALDAARARRQLRVA